MTLGQEPYVKCPRCGYDRNPTTATRCEICGFVLKKSAPLPWIGMALLGVAAGAGGYWYFTQRPATRPPVTSESPLAPTVTPTPAPVAVAPPAVTQPVGRLQADLLGHTGYINTVVFTPDGRYLLSASEDKTIRV
ncbi:MAG: hypothetical protein Q6J44_05395, partial [Gloeomargarita sp. DG02_4_bins_56]